MPLNPVFIIMSFEISYFSTTPPTTPTIIAIQASLIKPLLAEQPRQWLLHLLFLQVLILYGMWVLRSADIICNIVAIQASLIKPLLAEQQRWLLLHLLLLWVLILYSMWVLRSADIICNICFNRLSRLCRDKGKACSRGHFPGSYMKIN